MESHNLERPYLNTMETTKITEGVPPVVRKGLIWSLVVGTVFFLVLIVFIGVHFEDTKELIVILQKIGLMWLLLAILSQIATYILAGSVWYIIAQPTKYRLSLKLLAGLAVEQLSVNQLVPVGGLAGNIIIVKAMRRLGLPNALAMEVMFIDELSYYIAFSFGTFLALLLLFFYGKITPIILTLVVLFFAIELAVTIVIWTIVNHKKLKLPVWLEKKELILYILEAIKDVSSDRVFSIKLLVKTSLLRFGIFVLDAITLFAVMRAIDVKGTFAVAFVALIIASVAGALTLLPGGIGGFEAGSIAVLVTLGIPIEVAIAATILLRGLTLWIPLIPGLILARED